MKKNYILPSVILLLIFISSCSPKYYVPNTQNVPLLSRRGEINLTACGNTNQFEFQGAVAVTNHIGVVANGSYHYIKDDGKGNGGQGGLGEIGAGYYLPILGHFVFEAYGLAGYGAMENHMPGTIATYPGTSGKLNANIVRLALQPNIGFKSKYFSIGLSNRFVSLNFNDIRGNLMYGDVDQGVYLRNNRSLFVAEPAVTLRGGLDKIKLQLQVAGSYNLSNRDFMQENSLISLGLNVNL